MGNFLKTNRFLAGLVAGLCLAAVLMVVGTYIYFAGGFVPVATSAGPMPFEEKLARTALRATGKKGMPKTVPMEATETNLLAGVTIYQDHCAVCHGLPGTTETIIAKGMYPHPPQLFGGGGRGKGQATPQETYWKTANGIRLTGMPGFGNSLKEDQLWQVSLLLARSKVLPGPVKNSLRPVDAK